MIRELQRAGLRTSDALVDQVSYARDLWPRHHLTVRGGELPRHRPAGVVWPRSTEEVVAIVTMAKAKGVPIVPFGAGSGVCAGVLPERETIVVDLKRMNRWRRFDPDAPLLDVEAGHMGVPLEEKLQARGFTIGHFPSSILCSTVGGWVAARGAGQCSGRYGKIEDIVAAIECVTGAGDVVTAAQRSHGPSLVPLLVGSEGALAILTSVALRLHPAPRARALRAWSLPSMRQGWDAMRAMFQAGLRPAVARLYDPFDAMLARRGSVRREGRAKRAPGFGAIALRALLRRPKLMNELLESQAAGRAMGGALLVVIFEGDAPDAELARATDMLAARGAKDEGEGPAQRWLDHRYAVSFRQSPVLASGLFVDTMEVAATWTRLEAVYDGVRRALGPDVFVMAHMSHAYPDGCCIYFSFAGAPARGGDWERGCLARYDEAWRAAQDAVLEARGTVAHHHGVGRSKARGMRGELGEGMHVIRALKRAFDPSNIMNPGVFFEEGVFRESSGSEA